MVPAFTWLADFLREMESLGHGVVYLRNHEGLPDSLGNDVDLLVAKEAFREAELLAIECASRHGWRHLKSVEFGPLSMFFSDAKGAEFVHLDLFSSLDWHWLPFANTDLILARRQWNGLVFIPDPLDELLLNVLTRLFYQGVIRAKHRIQAVGIIAGDSVERLHAIFRDHLGQRMADLLIEQVSAGEWEALEAKSRGWRRLLLIHAVFTRPLLTFQSLFRYLRRSLCRLIYPPGPFIVFEGTDGVGKSSVIDRLHPFFKDITGRSDTLLFHWKPTRSSLRLAGLPSGPAMNTRSNARRSTGASFCFLTYHWLGFWVGYLRFVLPARSRNRAVVGDRYAYEFFLDPARLRLSLPTWLCRVAAATVPQPDLVIGMVAAPEAIIARKPELGIDEIRQYQLLLESLALSDKRWALVPSDGNGEHVSSNVRFSIIEKLISNR